MYTLKSIARRSTTLGMAVGLLVAAFIPTASVFADALNPLTERSLLLSSSAPGWQDTDGAGNVGTQYAPPGSGPNGKKTGQTFSFKVSSTAGISGMSLQYCTTAAGECQAPGNNSGDADPNDDKDTTDSTRLDNEDSALNANDGGWYNKTSDLNIEGVFTEGAGAGQFQVIVNNTPSTGWVMSSLNAESENIALPGGDVELTGKKNMIHLAKDTGGAHALTAGDSVQVVFRASSGVFITNPGADEFFVKINTYSTADEATFIPTVPYATNNNIVDGGVTVANVMTDSIHITTKVLETMSFSVGTQNPDTEEKAQWNDHGTCEAMDQPNNNRLDLGNPNAEYSLETGRAWDVFSYWRLSSNSSGGATVYYSGDTLANTVGDEIAPLTTKGLSQPGTEQFGLGFVDISNPSAHGDTLSDTFNTALGQPSTRYKAPSSYPFITVTGQELAAPFDTLAGQPISDDYADATGTTHVGSSPGTAQFKFNPASLTVPEAIAQQNETVISCASAKMRYVANIGADTPAGVYTTKINYLAAPQY